MSFCATRWVEGEQVASRALTAWPNVVIRHFLSLAQSKRPKNNKSYDTVVKHHMDSLMLVKMQFFKHIINILQTYLTRFQSDAPYIPFINDKMVQLFTKIIRYFLKRNLLEEARSDYKLINIDVAKKENRKESAVIKLPAATNNLLVKSGCSKEKKIKFQGEYAVILMNIIVKLQERSPVKSVVVRKASCLSPVNMARQSEISVAEFESLVNKLIQRKHLTAKEADGAKCQYDDFLKSIVRQNLSSFEEFNFSDDRLD